MMAFELKNCQTFKSTDVKRQRKVAWHGTRSKFLSVEGWWAVVATMTSMASMASMVSMARGSADVEVPLVLLVVMATIGDDWRRMVASVGGWGRRHTGR